MTVDQAKAAFKAMEAIEDRTWAVYNANRNSRGAYRAYVAACNAREKAYDAIVAAERNERAREDYEAEIIKQELALEKKAIQDQENRYWYANMIDEQIERDRGYWV